MDDTPAPVGDGHARPRVSHPPSPTSDADRRVVLSVVIPARNAAGFLPECLDHLRAADPRGEFVREWIVVDDGSSDETPAIAASRGAVVLRNPVSLGPAAARNAGALAASGDYVFFLDADVAPHPDALARIVGRLRARPDLVGMFGSYDDKPSAPGVVSRFRNLWHHHTHHQGRFGPDGARPIQTFWTGIGVIRRDIFLAVGGFDPRLYPKPAIEDIELGYRLSQMGYPVELVPAIRGTHLKRWTLAEMVRTDIMRRGVPWLLLRWRRRVHEADLNIQTSQKICVALIGISCLAMASALFPSPIRGFAAATAVASWGAIVPLNAGFYRLLARVGGWRLAVGALFPHGVYYFCCGLSVVLASVLAARERRGGAARWLRLAVPSRFRRHAGHEALAAPNVLAGLPIPPPRVPRVED